MTDKNNKASYDPHNIFARVLRGELPCDKVFENQHALALRDIAPQAPVHVLVIPKGAYANLTDFVANATTEEKLACYDAIGTVVKQLDLADGYRLIVNNGADARQEVEHLHWHILAGKDLGRMLP